MIEKTSTGLKMVRVKEPTLSEKSDTGMIEGTKEAWGFIQGAKENGLWQEMTGKDFGEWLADGLIQLWEWIITFSDIAILVAIVLVFIQMFGSKNAGKWLYWTVAFYIIIKLVGVATL